MANIRRTYDVFISHAAAEAALAAEVANAFRAGGLDAFTAGVLPPDQNISDALWEALAESRAVLALCSASGPTPSMAIELGAARAWNKPIFGLVTGPALTWPPQMLNGIRLYPLGRIDDVISVVKLAGHELTDSDRSLLAGIFAEVGVSVDQLALDPRHLEELVTRFRSGAGKAVSGERLLSELLRMRKQGHLAKTRHIERSKPNKGTG